MEEYVWAKENIFRHQQPGDTAIFNLDNTITRQQALRAPGRALYFSRQAEPENGVFLRGDAVISRRDGHERQIMTTEDIRLPGVHNVENYMAAIAAVEGLVPDETIRTFARTFNGVEHRIELVRTYHGVRFYNDSIASVPPHQSRACDPLRRRSSSLPGAMQAHSLRRAGSRGGGAREAAGAVRRHRRKDPRCRGAGSRLPAGPSGNTGCDTLSAGCGDRP